MREKFTELNNSIIEDLSELSDVQKSTQEEINNVKAKIASLGDSGAITEDVKALRDLTSQLKSSFKAKEESIDWLMNNALHVESVTANSNEIEVLKNEQKILKKDVEEQKVAIRNSMEKISTNEDSGLKGEFERVLKEFQQLSSSVSEMEGNYISANNDLLKEIDTNRDGLELRFKPLESQVEMLTSEASSLGSLKTSLEEYSRRLNAAEEAITGLKHPSSFSDGQGSPEVSATLSILKEAQQAFSQEVDELRSSIAALPNAASDFANLQVEVTSLLEGQKQQIDEIKEDYEQLKSNVGSSEQAPAIDGLSSSIKKLESDLRMMREAVDSLVAYSVKIETHDNDLKSVHESIEDLQQSTDKLLVKFEHIQESV